MDDMESRMNEEQKDNQIENRMNKMEKEIKSIKQNVKELLANNINPEKVKLKSWLENTVGLPQYYEIFIEAGIEDLLTVSLLKMETIKEIGVDKIGHQIKILHQIDRLYQNDNQPKHEGTSYIG